MSLSESEAEERRCRGIVVPYTQHFIISAEMAIGAGSFLYKGVKGLKASTINPKPLAARVPCC